MKIDQLYPYAQKMSRQFGGISAVCFIRRYDMRRKKGFEPLNFHVYRFVPAGKKSRSPKERFLTRTIIAPGGRIINSRYAELNLSAADLTAKDWEVYPHPAFFQE